MSTGPNLLRPVPNIILELIPVISGEKCRTTTELAGNPTVHSRVQSTSTALYSEGGGNEHNWAVVAVVGGRRMSWGCGTSRHRTVLCRLGHSWATAGWLNHTGFPSGHYTRLHYMTLHYTALHYTGHRPRGEVGGDWQITGEHSSTPTDS